MKTIIQSSLLAFIFMLGISACKSSSHYGEAVKDPFSASKYKSDKRYFRASGKGTSSKDHVAEKKADHNAKAELASQVQTTFKIMADEYMTQKENDYSGEVLEKFESLSREVVNTSMVDLRKVDEKKYYNGTQYTVFSLYEIKKKDMFNFMKKQAKTQNYVDKKTMNLLEDLIDEQLKELEE